MELGNERQISSSLSKSDREGQISNDVPCKWNLKKKKIIQMNLPTKEKQTH